MTYQEPQEETTVGQLHHTWQTSFRKLNCQLQCFLEPIWLVHWWIRSTANRKMNAGITLPSNTVLVFFDILKQCKSASRFKLNGTTISSTQGHKFWNQTSPDYVVYGWLFYPKKQFPSCLSSLELAFQIVATYAFDNVLNRLIYSALLQWRSSVKKQAYISLFPHLVILLSFPPFHINFY